MGADCPIIVDNKAFQQGHKSMADGDAVGSGIDLFFPMFAALQSGKAQLNHFLRLAYLSGVSALRGPYVISMWCLGIQRLPRSDPSSCSEPSSDSNSVVVLWLVKAALSTWGFHFSNSFLSRMKSSAIRAGLGCIFFSLFPFVQGCTEHFGIHKLVIY